LRAWSPSLVAPVRPRGADVIARLHGDEVEVLGSDRPFEGVDHRDRVVVRPSYEQRLPAVAEHDLAGAAPRAELTTTALEVAVRLEAECSRIRLGPEHQLARQLQRCPQRRPIVRDVLSRNEPVQLGSIELARPERILDAKTLRVEQVGARDQLVIAVLADHEHADQIRDIIITTAVVVPFGMIGPAQALAPSSIHPAADERRLGRRCLCDPPDQGICFRARDPERLRDRLWGYAPRAQAPRTGKQVLMLHDDNSRSRV
jgi:hypothetical protein